MCIKKLYFVLSEVTGNEYPLIVAGDTILSITLLPSLIGTSKTIPEIVLLMSVLVALPALFVTPSFMLSCAQFSNITKYVYLNDKKPENKNFCVVDTARNKCKYFDGKKWVIGKTTDKVTKIFDNIHNMLTDPFEKEHINKTIEFIKANPKKYNEKWIKVSNTYLKSLYDEEDKENMENKIKVLEELKLIFFNNKDEILKIT